MSLLICLQVAVGLTLNQKSFSWKVNCREREHTGDSQQGHMKGSEETECYKYLVFNFSALIGKLSFESHTQ